MAHFAQIGLNNVVKNIVVVDESFFEDGEGNRSEENAIQRLINNTGHLTWVQTSYNTRNGVYLNQDLEPSTAKQPLRKNYAVIGGTYDPDRDAFIPPKPFDSWILNEDTCDWDPPTPYPTDGGQYDWDEATQTWILWKTAEEYAEFILTEPPDEDDPAG